jgi:hypothetical protein
LRANAQKALKIARLCDVTGQPSMLTRDAGRHNAANVAKLRELLVRKDVRESGIGGAFLYRNSVFIGKLKDPAALLSRCPHYRSRL